jgi:NAD(P)-dependent dehydrogenase (short-subunit alcohol dehydrogenase family)
LGQRDGPQRERWVVAGLVRPVAVVTGSASGIGLAVARAAAERGYRIAAIDVAAVRHDAPIARHSGGSLLDADVGDPAQLATAIDEAAERGPIDLVVSAAGILDEVLFDRISDELLARTLRVHVGGLFNLLQACAPHLRARGEGSIVAIASELMMVGAVGHAHYVSAKAALAGLVRAAAREFAPNAIRVNAVAPGPVDTPLLGPSGRVPAYVSSIALGRLGRPEEVAAAVLDVAAWPWATGAIVAVNGGAVIRA